MTADYFWDRSVHQLEPGLLFEFEKIKPAIEEHAGAKAISVADPWEPDQIRLGMYIGITTPKNNNEVVHYHSVQHEAYVIIEGEAEVTVKYRWDGNNWQRRVVRRGDIIVMQPEVCHYFRWRSKTGIAVVFKAPNDVGGVGKPPAAKTTCAQGCPHFEKDCGGFSGHPAS